MGRKVEPAEAFDLHAFATSLLRLKYNEDAAIAMLRLFTMFGHLEKALGVSRVERARFEYSVPGGRIDLLLFHVDGGLSVIEAKSGYSNRDCVGGIGQLFFYENAVRKLIPDRYINKILVAPVSAEKAIDIAEVCALAAVKFVPLPVATAVRAEIDAHQLLAA